jgi:hypothetical protein
MQDFSLLSDLLVKVRLTLRVHQGRFLTYMHEMRVRVVRSH